VAQKLDSEYEVKFINAKGQINFQSRIHSIQIDSEMGRSSVLTLQLVLSSEEIKALTLDSLPKSIQVLWANRLYFTGESTRFQVIGHSRVEIIFEDFLHRFDKMFTEVQTKQQKLKSFLEKLVSNLQTKPTLKFCSMELFDEELPTFTLNARSVREVLSELSQFYGFTYFIRPDQSSSSPLLCFLRTGKGLNSGPISVQLDSALDKVITSHHIDWKYDRVTVQLMDGMGDNKKKPLRTDSFKQPLEGFKSGEKMKSQFEIHLPELDIPVSHPDLYARAEKILPYQYNLRQQSLDSKLFTQTEANLQIGDWIQVKESFSEYQNAACYLVHSTRLVIQSSQPKLQIKAVRP
jgi:hypothetical protein